MTELSDVDGPSSERVRLRRGVVRARYDQATVHAILDEALVAHVGVNTPDGPIVLPMAFGRTDSRSDRSTGEVG